eukprot:3937424-Amphidinium_carterae.2
MFKAKASPARVRKISSSAQASITEAFQGLQLDHKCMFGQSTPFLTVRDVFIGWVYAYPVVDKSKPEVERVLRHIIGRILVSDSAPELLAANTFNLAHFALTLEQPQQSGHVERSNSLVSELAGIYLQQRGVPKKIFWWKAAVRTAATALSLIPQEQVESQPLRRTTFDTPSWLAEVPSGSLVWARLNPSHMVKGEAKLYLAMFIGWDILPGLPSLGTFGCYLGANCRERWRHRAFGVSGVQNSQIQELDDFEGELESEIEDEKGPVEEVSGTPKLDFQPPAIEKEITQRVKRDEKVAEWHAKILVKPGGGC